jgi:phosphoribosylformylglycinamidine synthase
MLTGLEGMELGIWVAHGEGRFVLPYPEEKYNVVMKYSRSHYPANPNGSMHDVAGICSADGRHLAMMPHLETGVHALAVRILPCRQAQRRHYTVDAGIRQCKKVD